MKPKTKIRRPNSIVNDAWLGLGDINGIEITNPLTHRSQHDIENPGQLEVKLMKDPNYLSFASKVLLDIDLLPEQAVILEELWFRPFPMFIASRGFGKSFLLALYATLKCVLVPGTKVVGTGAAYRQSRIIWEYMSSIWRNAPVLRSICDRNSGPRTQIDRVEVRINDSSAIFCPLGDGCLTQDSLITCKDGFRFINYLGNESMIRDDDIWDGDRFQKSDEYYYNGIKPCNRITTKKGFEISGTLNHMIKILRNNKIKFIRFDEIKKGDYVLIDRSERWHNGNFSCNSDQAYSLGAMIGDGCWTNQYQLRFTTKDEEIINLVKQGTGFKFTQCGDLIHYNHNSKQNRQDWLDFWDLKTCYTINKILPHTILSSSKSNMTSCLQGLFDTDGHIQISTKKGGISLTVGFTNTSKILVQQIQYILLHYGIISYVSNRKRKKEWNISYELLITGSDSVKFINEIGFRLSRKQDLATSAIRNKVLNRSIGDIIPNIQPILSKYKGFAKAKFKKNITHNLAQEFLDKFGHIDNDEINNLKELCNPDISYDEVANIRSEGPQITYDIHIPNTHKYIANGFISHNTKVRGLRANIILADEFASIPPDIYETVVGGFASVSMKPIDNVKEAASRTALKDLGKWSEIEEKRFTLKTGNQNIISGTADYDFMHFAEYWRKYWVYTKSQNDPNKIVKMPNGEIKTLKDYFPDGIPEEFDSRDYSIIRIPYEKIPKGFMDDKIVARAKATVHSSIYLKEYGAVFPSDSDGFFKRTLIESIVAHSRNINSPHWPTWCPNEFDPLLRGAPDKQYVIAIDPAAYQDNFAIIVLELWQDHVRLVHCWSTNLADFQARKRAGLIQENDYYGFCSRKIRNLAKVFPSENIVIDAQGGGLSVVEALHDPIKLNEGEVPWWPTNAILNPDKDLDTDVEAGKHIIHLFQFAKYEWVAEANNGTRKDMEDKVLIFPRFDTVQLEISGIKDAELAKRLNVDRLFDTLEDTVLEIEALKDELCTIQVTRTGTGVQGRERFDTPETTTAEGRKTRMRKDRYSALVMANFIARNIQRAPAAVEYNVIGGFAHQITKKECKSEDMYASGPDWFIKAMNAKGSKNVISSVKRNDGVQ